jgi:hypothetical protein
VIQLTHIFSEPTMHKCNLVDIHGFGIFILYLAGLA